VAHEFIGVWKASTYLPSGKRTDHMLLLNPTGRYAWMTTESDGSENATQGSWRAEQNGQVIHFIPEGDETQRPALWRVMDIAGIDRDGTFMVLRWMVMAARNLPVLFYRVTQTV
jgi:hypothetical protein